MSTAYAAPDAGLLPDRTQRISAEVKRLGLVYLWITIATSGVVFAEPAPHDLLLVGATVVLPLLGLVTFNRGVILYLLLWLGILAASFLATAQAEILDIPTKHTVITAYLALSSVVIVAFTVHRPYGAVPLIMSAYVVAALIATGAGLIGYFNVVPGVTELFTVEGFRVSGTFKDPNVLGAFLVPPLIYVLHVLIGARGLRAVFWLVIASILLLGILLTFSRGAWFNLALSVAAYVYLTFAAASTHRHRLKLVIWIVLGGALSVGILAAALNVPKVAELMSDRLSLQNYDVGSEGRFPGQMRAINVLLTKPLGLGALEFGRLYKNDVHQVYISMFLNAGWVGGTLYIAVVLLTLWLGMQRVVRDRGGDLVSAVLLASFIGVVAEGAVVDTDHWRHFFLIMAMIWGLALAPDASVTPRARANAAVTV